MRDGRIVCPQAETAADNRASQVVLERNGFRQVGVRQDAGDGPLVCWRRETT